MAQPLGYYGLVTIEEFYSSYAASLLNSIHIGHSKKLKKQLPFRLSPPEHVMVHGERVDISETTINRFLFGPDYRAPPDSLFIGRHLKFTDEG